MRPARYKQQAQTKLHCRRPGPAGPRREAGRDCRKWTEKDQLGILAQEFENWRHSGGIASQLCESDRVDSAFKEFAKTDSEKALFLGELTFKRGELDKASAFYEKAFGAELLREGDEYAFLDSAASELGLALEEILSGHTPRKGIYEVLVERRRFLQVLQADPDRAAYESVKARDAAAPINTLDEMALYVFTAVHPMQSWDEEHLIHKALYWAGACWAHLHHTALLLSPPQRYPDGPYFKEIATLITRWRDNAPPLPHLVIDAVVQVVLDAAVEHVKCLGCIAAIAEVKREPLWAFTGDRMPMALLVDVYSRSDPTGALHRIFPSILAPPPESVA